MAMATGILVSACLSPPTTREVVSRRCKPSLSTLCVRSFHRGVSFSPSVNTLMASFTKLLQRRNPFRSSNNVIPTSCDSKEEKYASARLGVPIFVFTTYSFTSSNKLSPPHNHHINTLSLLSSSFFPNFLPPPFYSKILGVSNSVIVLFAVLGAAFSHFFGHRPRYHRISSSAGRVERMVGSQPPPACCYASHMISTVYRVRSRGALGE